jgi:hypothetical protein
LRLGGRLAKLEAQRFRPHSGPRIIVHDIVWRTDDGEVRSIGQMARVLTGSGWETINRAADEPEAEFQHRAEVMASNVEASITARSQAPLQPLRPVLPR